MSPHHASAPFLFLSDGYFADLTLCRQTRSAFTVDPPKTELSGEIEEGLSYRGFDSPGVENNDTHAELLTF